MTNFDREYYQRFYGGETAVHDAKKIAHLASAVHELCAWWGVAPSTVLDVGAGMGAWRDWYHANHPEVQVFSIDNSSYACEQWGHQQRSIVTWRPLVRYGLVVCHSVLQYLTDEEAEAAIDNLGAATGRVLYLEAPTARDFEEVVDKERTDMAVHARDGSWYRARLDRYFRQVGAGLWIRRGALPMFELEALPE